MIILGIESSCDETSAAVLVNGALKSNIISSQFFHSNFGGIVPELASRAHLQAVVPIIKQALSEAGVTINDITHCAATQGPGLIGSLLVGLNAAKGIAVSRGIPFLPIHHIEAHLFSPFLQDTHPEFPFLGLIVSGGHTLIIRVEGLGRYTVEGSTIDDAAGEAFDKVAKMLGLGFPGGPAIEAAAKNGNPKAIEFPRPLIDSGDLNFSFSGIKTSVLYFLRKNVPQGTAIPSSLIHDISACFQRAAVDVLTSKILDAAERFNIRDIAVAGGVSANKSLQQTLGERAAKRQIRVFVPDLIFSTDNAAMVAMLAYLKLQGDESGSLRAPAFARISDTLFHG